MFQIVQATTRDLLTLNKIAFSSKSYWGYPQHWLDTWKGEIAISEESFKNEVVNKAIDASGDHLGYYRLLLKDRQGILNGFWVLPDHMGQGIGRALFEHMVATAQELGIKTVTWESDPNTEAFYTHMGAKRVDSRTYWLDGSERTLPIFEVYPEV